MTIISPVVHAYPYVILLIVCATIFVALFWKFPSLRNYRKKRSLLVYPLMALVLALVVFQAYDVSLGPALVSYTLSNSNRAFVAGQVNQLDLSSSSNGVRAANFYMVVRSVNASFTGDGPQNCIQVNITCIKVPFTFPQKGSEIKSVFFTVEKNVTDFEFHSALEEDNAGRVLVIACTTTMRCVWDSTSSSFTIDAPLTVA